MTLMITACLATLLSAGLGFALAALLERWLPARSGVWVWRAARLAAVSPVLTVLFFAIIPLIAEGFASVAPRASVSDAGQAILAPGLAVDVSLALTGVSNAAASLPGWIGPALVLVYGAGVLAAALRMASRRRSLRRLLAASRPAGPGLEQVASRWRGRLGLADTLCPIRVVDADISPFVVGLRPMIVAPETLETAPSADFAIAHECMHVRRGDEQDRLIGEVLATLFWFNGFVRAIERRLCGARELACDADLIETLQPEQVRDYAAAIADAAPAAAASAFLSDLRDLRRRRIQAVLKPSSSRKQAATLAAAAGLALCAAAPGAALALAINAAELQDAEPVRELAPRTLSAPVGERVLQVQDLIAAEDYESALELTTQLLELELTAYERSVVLQLEGGVLFELNAYAGSVERFEQAIATGALDAGEEARLYLNVLQLHAVLEDYAAAADYADLYLAHGGDISVRTQITLAQIYVQVDRIEDALPLAQAGIGALEDPTASQLQLLEYIYQELGRDEDRARVQARLEALEQP